MRLRASPDLSQKGSLPMSPAQPQPGNLSALRLETLGGDVGLLTFDLPGSRANTLGQAILAEFESVLQQLRARTDLHGLILRSGKPGMFIAGADLKELGSLSTDEKVNRSLGRRGLDVMAGFENLPYPT